MATTRRRTISEVAKPESRHLLALLREKAGLTMREVARFAGVAPATICRVEAGKMPDVHSAIKLARFFETTVEALWGAGEE